MHWRTPKVMTPLVQDFSRFVSRSIELGAHAQLLDEATRKTMGYVLGEDGQVVHVSVPFGAPGGYRMVCTGQTNNKCCVFMHNTPNTHISLLVLYSLYNRVCD